MTKDYNVNIEDLQITYVPQYDLIETLKNFPEGDVSFDYETSALDMWAYDFYAFSFGLCLTDDPLNSLHYFYFDVLNDAEKEVLKKFLIDRKPWVFNYTYEGGVSWVLFNELILMNDVRCLFKVDGQQALSLKKGAMLYCNANNWSEFPWQCVETLEELMKFLNKYYLKIYKENREIKKHNEIAKRKKKEKEIRPIAKYLMKGDKENAFKWVEDNSENSWETFKGKSYEKKIIKLLYRNKDHISKEDILEAIRRSKLDESKVNLSYVNRDIVGPYCCFDVYWTSILKQKLWDSCKTQYNIYLEQSYISTVMTAYGAIWDLDKLKEIEKEYLEKCFYYYRKLFEIKQFTPCKNDGSPIDPNVYVEMKNFTHKNEYKAIWNLSSNKKESVNCFYDSLYKSKKFTEAMIAYHIYKYCQKFEEMTIRKEGKEKTIISYLKWNTMEKVLPIIVKWVKNYDIKRHEEHKILSENPNARNNFYESNKLSIEIKKAINITKWYRDSHRDEMIQGLYNAYCICANGDPDQNFDGMDWEFQMIFCFRMIKKIEKCLNTYIYGDKIGRGNIQSANTPKEFMHVPERVEIGDIDSFFRLNFNENAKITKRWSAGVHTIGWNTELRELFVSRYNNSIIIHYDQSQSEIRVIAALANETALLKAFEEGRDIHRFVASRVFSKPEEEITDSERRYSKQVTFGLLYGMGENEFANTYLFGDIIKAKKIFEGFFSAFPNIKIWCEEMHKMVMNEGYVLTAFGDKLPIFFNPHSDRSVKQAYRDAQNYPVQSTSSSIAALGIWNLYYNYVIKYKLKAIPNGFTHDSSDWEVYVKHLVAFMMATRKAAVDDTIKRYNIPMEIDLALGVTQNFMLNIENPKFNNGGVNFNFNCCSIFFDQIIEKLKIGWNIKYDIIKEKVEKSSYNELFKEKRIFSYYIGKELVYFKGNMELIKREVHE